MNSPFRVMVSLLCLLAAVGGRIASREGPGILLLNGTNAREHPWDERPSRRGRLLVPCQSLHVQETGAVCDGYHLDFPEVLLKDVLQGDRHLPRRSGSVLVPKKAVGEVVFHNIRLTLSWEPATPEFLQVHLPVYLPCWDNRIPYRLFWNARYEICTQRCSTFSAAGEYLPGDIEDLPPELAADVNFNGAPAAFWNQNVKP